MDGMTDGRMDGRMDGWMDGWMEGRKGGWTDGMRWDLWLDSWTGGRTDGNTISKLEYSLLRIFTDFTFSKYRIPVIKTVCCYQDPSTRDQSTSTSKPKLS